MLSSKSVQGHILLFNILLCGNVSFLLFKRKKALIIAKRDDGEKQVGRHKGKDVITSKDLNTESHINPKKTIKKQKYTAH